VQIAVSPLELCLSFRAGDFVAVLWSAVALSSAVTLSFHCLIVLNFQKVCALYYKQARQCMYNVELRRFRAITVAVEKQYILTI
jgi:hypothetical protein